MRKRKAKNSFFLCGGVMKKFRNIALVLLILLTALALILCTYYNISISSVSKDNTEKEITINQGSINSIAVTLKENNLIKNVTMFKIYIKLNNKTNLKAGTYLLSENMGVKKIVDILSGGSSYNPDEISITFKEGINIRDIAHLISEKTNNSYDSVMNLATDSSYIDTLIGKYWFLTDDVKDKDIYYSLEGYLYPNTYRFANKDVKVSIIFETMLDEMERQLDSYRDEISQNKLSIHELITLSSIVELEGAKANDRRKVAGVFYNRLESNSYPTLGSDVTTYYASKIDDWSYSLTYKELNDCTNKYNTRCSSNTGLPVGPICNPSVDSIKATLNPEKHNYYYFVADCKGKVYLSENSTVHQNTINKLKKENNWCA